MKKMKFIAPLLVLPAAILPVVSCAENRIAGKVVLVGYNDGSSVGVDGKDYWLAAEPLVTVKTKALNLHNVGNVQTLYGEHGFNQAVLVCKKELLTKNANYLKQVQQLQKDNFAFISNTANRETIINCINACLTTGKSETLTLNNCTTQTLINCNGKYVDQFEDLKTYYSFLEKAVEINQDIQKPLDPYIFYNGYPTTTSSNTDEIRIVCPDGAPAVGLANLICKKDSLPNTTKIEVIDPSLIMQKIHTNDASIAVLPSNLATKLYNEHGKEYVWLSTVTWGNLYILSKTQTTTLIKENLANELNGKNMGVLQINSVPGIVLKIILKQNNIEYHD